MRCPFCKANQDKVVDSRSADGGRSIRRRRECLACGRRFTTREHVEDNVRLQIIKRDGSRVPYQREKIARGIRHAAYKRPVSAERIEQIVDEIEEYLVSHFEKEVSSQTVGERIATVLQRVDKVAYVRFASVYRQFRDVGDFIDEAQQLMQRPQDIPGQKNLFEGPAES